jgi:glutathione S-transferase
MLQIKGRKTSSNVMKVLWLCDELGIPYEREDIGGKFGGNDQPEYLALNPNGRVPTIIDDGFVLWESNACVRYLAAKHGKDSAIWPDDPHTRASADRWMDWNATSVSPAVGLFFRNLIRETEETRNMDEVARGFEQSTELFKMLDVELAGHDYVAGDEFTVGDIPVGVFVRRYIELVPGGAADQPNLLAWFERLKARPAYHHCLIPLE